MSVGRNDPCPCGSGKKYKKCCYLKPKFHEWELNTQELLSDVPYGDVIGKTLMTSLYTLDRETWWEGACHSTTGILYVLLREQGIPNVKRVLSEVKHPLEIDGRTIYFDHSWITINGGVYDLAIYKSLDHRLSWAPTINGFDIQTKQPTDLEYGVTSPIPADPGAVFVGSMSFVEYMDGFLGHPDGLWGYVQIIGEKLGIDLSDVRSKYVETAPTR
ncbi:hypothetical protein GCM10025859_63650 [Alicyclobacillus fastidiosus]|nr:hypothetical protein GCM10025859_61900 [Alicyclobacillus fastidiosus]GMA65924.1 hypothetical protein GCM10025859_63650 [Alicyclobacillus fastidiosus]